MPKFSFQKFSIFNMITDSFLIGKWETIERAKRYVYLDFQGSVRFSTFQVAY